MQFTPRHATVHVSRMHDVHAHARSRQVFLQATQALQAAQALKAQAGAEAAEPQPPVAAPEQQPRASGAGPWEVLRWATGRRKAQQ